MKKYRIHKIRTGPSWIPAIAGGMVGSVMTALLMGPGVQTALAGMAVFDATNFAKNAAQEALGQESLGQLVMIMETIGSEVAPAIMSSGILADGEGSAIEGITDGIGGYDALSGLTEFAGPVLEEEFGDILSGSPISAEQATTLFRNIFAASQNLQGGNAPGKMMLQRATENIVKRSWTMHGQSQKRAETLKKLISLAATATASNPSEGSLRTQTAVNAAIQMNQTQAIMELHTTMLQLAELMAMQEAKELNEGRKPGAAGTWPNPDESAGTSGTGSGEWPNPDDNPNVFGG